MKMQGLIRLIVASLFSVIALTAPYAGNGENPPGATLFTTQNLWFEDHKELWCINFKSGEMIPAGTEVYGVRLAKPEAGKRKGAGKQAIYFVRASDRQPFWINMNAKYHPGKTIEDYMQYLFSNKDIGTLTIGLTDAEIEAIKRGVVVEGMSKRAVLISYGMPPEHKTSSLENNRWYYWMTRFNSKDICFDKQEKAVDCEAFQLEGEL